MKRIISFQIKKINLNQNINNIPPKLKTSIRFKSRISKNFSINKCTIHKYCLFVQSHFFIDF